MWVDDASTLEKLFRMAPRSFALYCWNNHIIPFTNRYGIGSDGEKTKHAVLMKLAGRGKDEFMSVIVDHYDHCITLEEAFLCVCFFLCCLFSFYFFFMFLLFICLNTGIKLKKYFGGSSATAC